MAVSFRLDQVLGANRLDGGAADAHAAFHLRVKGLDMDDTGLSDRDIDAELAGASELACRRAYSGWANETETRCVKERWATGADLSARYEYRPMAARAGTARAMLQATEAARKDLGDRVSLVESAGDLAKVVDRLAENPRLLSLLDAGELQRLVDKAKRVTGTGDTASLRRLTTCLLMQITRTSQMNKLPANEKRTAIDNYAHALLFIPQDILAEKLTENPDAMRALPMHRRSNVLDYVYYAEISKFRAVAAAFDDLWIARDQAMIAQRLR